MEKVQQQFIDALKKHHWAQNHNNREKGQTPDSKDVLKPFLDLAEYVSSAKSSGLKKQEQCAYAGSVLLDSLLEVTGRRFTYDLEEANDVFMAGKNLANDLWEKMDGKEMEDLILSEYERFRMAEGGGG